MIYLSGTVVNGVSGIGFMMTPNSNIYSTIPSGIPWAADSGRFANPAAYSDDKFLAWLDSFDRDDCLFATAPDVLANHAQTLALSLPMMPQIRALGYKAAFVAQDGFDGAPWDEFDCIFIGGTTAFKLGERVPRIIDEARKRGKWAHMGRVNSYKRLRVAKAIGCDSADGTFIKFAPTENIERMQKWLNKLADRPLLWTHASGQ